MNKYILSLVILFIPLIIFAQSEKIRVKAIQNNTTVKVKILLDKREIEENNYIKTEYYYTNLTARANDEVLFNISMGPTISNDGIFTFKFENRMSAKMIQFYITDNKGDQKTVTVPIIPSEKLNKDNGSSKALKPITYTIEDHHEVGNADVWRAKTSDEAIKKLYGSPHFSEDKIQVFAPEVSNNYSSVPITIKSDIKLESIAIMIDAHENPTIAIYTVPSTGIVEYSLRIVLPTDPNKMNLIVIGKGVDGKFYRRIQEIKVSVCSGT